MRSTMGSARRWLMAALAALTVGLVGLVGPPVGAQEAPPTSTTRPVTTVPAYPCCFEVTATPTSGLHDGDLVTIRVRETAGRGVGDVTTAWCRSGPANGPNADEGWGHECLSGGAITTRISNSEVMIARNVWTGTRSFSGPAYPVSITCDESHPCNLGLRITGGSSGSSSRYYYKAVTLSFAPGGTASTSTTTTTVPPPPPPNPACTAPSGVPRWFWQLILRFLKIRCPGPGASGP